MNWSVFFTRTLSAIVYAAVMIFGIVYNPMSILILVALLQFLCTREYFALSKIIYSRASVPGYFFVIACLVSVYCIIPFVLHESYLFYPLLLVPVILFLISGISKGKLLAAALICLNAILYIGVPLALLVDIRQQQDGAIFALGVLVLIWVNDTMAYIVGSMIGRTKFTDISPKKTIEGTVGGIICTMVAAWIIIQYIETSIQLAHWIVVAGLVAVAGTLGDLLESQIKRSAGVKDSGNLLPGHGGALDRLDSLLVVLPFVYVYFHLFIVG